jgi:hypothetical protein
MCSNFEIALEEGRIAHPETQIAEKDFKYEFETFESVRNKLESHLYPDLDLSRGKQ